MAKTAKTVKTAKTESKDRKVIKVTKAIKAIKENVVKRVIKAKTEFTPSSIRPPKIGRM